MLILSETCYGLCSEGIWISGPEEKKNQTTKNNHTNHKSTNHQQQQKKAWCLNCSSLYTSRTGSLDWAEELSTQLCFSLLCSQRQGLISARWQDPSVTVQLVSKFWRCRQISGISCLLVEQRMRWGPLNSLSAWFLVAAACGKKAVFLSRISLSQDNSLIPPAEVVTLFREALNTLRALQCKQGVLVTLCCQKSLHVLLFKCQTQLILGEESQLTAALFLKHALSISLQSCSFFISLYPCFCLLLIKFPLVAHIQKELGRVLLFQ